MLLAPIGISQSQGPNAKPIYLAVSLLRWEQTKGNHQPAKHQTKPLIEWTHLTSHKDMILQISVGFKLVLSDVYGFTHTHQPIQPKASLHA